MKESLDIVLKELRKRQMDLSHAIETLNQIAQEGKIDATEDDATEDDATEDDATEDDSYAKLNAPEAIHEFLLECGKAQKTKDIALGLIARGFKTKSKPKIFYVTITKILQECEDSNSFIKVKRGVWGLSEWYKGKIPTNNSKEFKCLFCKDSLKSKRIFENGPDKFCSEGCLWAMKDQNDESVQVAK